jgi:hypothetical protein
MFPKVMLSTDRLPTDRLPTDRLSTDRLSTNRLSTDRLSTQSIDTVNSFRKDCMDTLSFDNLANAWSGGSIL